MTTRTEHLEWCKGRAIECLNTGSIHDAWASMVSDLQNHDETRDHAWIEIGTVQLFSGMTRTKEEMKSLIEGFG